MSCLTAREQQIVSQVVARDYPTVALPDALREVALIACVGSPNFSAFETAHQVCSELEAIGGQTCRMCIPFKRKDEK